MSTGNSQTLVQKTISGLKWNYISMVLNITVQIISTAVLARLLNPSDYGLVAMANVLLGFVSYFAQLGIGPAIIQKKNLDSSDIITAYLIAIISSIFFTILLIILAPLGTFIFSNQDIVTILRVMSINLIFSSISMVSISLLRKEFKFFLLGALDLISFICGTLFIGIGMALMGFGVWSLVFSTIMQGFLSMILTSFYVRQYVNINKPTTAKAKELINYGSKYSISSFLEYITYRSDAAIIGHYFPASLLGIYNRAYLLIQLPAQYISTNIIKVLFSTLNEVREEKERFLKYFYSLTTVLGLALFGSSIFVAINAKEIVLIILGTKWEASINILRILSVAIPFHLLINYQGLVYDVYNYLNAKVILKIFHFVIILFFYFLMLSKGIEGIALGFLFTEVLLYSINVLISTKVLSIKLGDIVRLHKPFILIIIFVGIPALIIKYINNYLNLSTLIIFISEIIIVPIVASIGLIFFMPTFLKIMISDFIKSVNSKKNAKTKFINKLLNNYLIKISAN
jgi:O-antigen/teichoic acid export membrane protein